MPPPTLILAGGTARRMGGGDKPLLTLGGKTIIQRIIDTLDTGVTAATNTRITDTPDTRITDTPDTRITDTPDTRITDATTTPYIAISANGDAARFQAFGLPVLDDGPFADHGPLAGVLAGLEWAAGLGAESLLTIPGDTPFVPSGLAAALTPAPSCARSGGRMHPLVALWPVLCRAELRTFLQTPGGRQVSRFTEWISCRPVDFPIDVCDPFLNVNTPDELARARDLAKRIGTGDDR